MPVVPLRAAGSQSDAAVAELPKPAKIAVLSPSPNIGPTQAYTTADLLTQPTRCWHDGQGWDLPSAEACKLGRGFL